MKMNNVKHVFIFVASIVTIALMNVLPSVCALEKPLRVVTTLSDYADLARRIGGEHVSVSHIVEGNQDAHFIRPKPSFVNLLKEADIFIETGLDLETWVPSLIDRSGNNNIRSGHPGYIAAASGMDLLEKPAVMSRIEGGLHIYGNPHVTTSPLNMITAASNIAAGLIRNRPALKDEFLKNHEKLVGEFHERLFGAELVKMLGGDTLESLCRQGKLLGFLEEKTYQGKPLLGKLGGWLGRLKPYKGVPIVTYHKNWIYFFHLFSLREGGFIEPKPGIPPSPKHLAQLKKSMEEMKVPLILAANYFSDQAPNQLAKRVGAQVRMVPYYVGGSGGVDSYFALVDCWVEGIVDAIEVYRKENS